MTSRIPLPRWLPCATQERGGCQFDRMRITKDKGNYSSRKCLNDSDHHSVTLRNINLEAAEVFFSNYWSFTELPSLKLTLVSGRLTFIKEATFRSNILRMGCLRFRGQATAVDVGKILQERFFLQSWGSGPWDETSTKKPGGLVVQPWHLCTDTLLMCMHVTFWHAGHKIKELATSEIPDWISLMHATSLWIWTLTRISSFVTKIISKDMQCFALPKLISHFLCLLSIHLVKS